MTATAHEPSTEESKPDLTESDDFKSMHEQDAKWSGSKLIAILLVTLALAIAFIYFISGLGQRG